MLRTSRFLLALLLVLGAALLPLSLPLIARAHANPADPPVQGGKVMPVAANAADLPFIEHEISSEQLLLQLANQSRAEAGLPGLMLDDGLSQAARIHAQAMVDARQLSHHFHGEPSLAQRLAAATRLQLDQAGENVAFDSDAERGHRHLMLSAPHRANLLNPGYNVVGLAVVRSGDRLYIVEDFGHALLSYSRAQAKRLVASAVNQLRLQSNRPVLQRRDLVTADSAACSMAEADKLGTPPVHQLAKRYTVLSFTSLHPEALPDRATRAITSPNLRSFSVGACYARTHSYPTGVYWVVLSLD